MMHIVDKYSSVPILQVLVHLSFLSSYLKLETELENSMIEFQLLELYKIWH